MQNNVGGIHFSVIAGLCSVQSELWSGTVYAVKLSEYKDLVSHSNAATKNSVMCCWHCRHVFLFRNIYMIVASASRVLASALASAYWHRLTSLPQTDSSLNSSSQVRTRILQACPLSHVTDDIHGELLWFKPTV